ncbi:MAG: hypothetical protein M1826_007210 [Phylliscum demangeonii]|nr:MAG: hypothetical protein M1826_007210 [Phylliscum demangeonii]
MSDNQPPASGSMDFFRGDYGQDGNDRSVLRASEEAPSTGPRAERSAPDGIILGDGRTSPTRVGTYARVGNVNVVASPSVVSVRGVIEGPEQQGHEGSEAQASNGVDREESQAADGVSWTENGVANGVHRGWPRAEAERYDHLYQSVMGLHFHLDQTSRAVIDSVAARPSRDK